MSKVNREFVNPGHQTSPVPVSQASPGPVLQVPPGPVLQVPPGPVLQVPPGPVLQARPGTFDCNEPVTPQFLQIYGEKVNALRRDAADNFRSLTKSLTLDDLLKEQTKPTLFPKHLCDIKAKGDIENTQNQISEAVFTRFKTTVANRMVELSKCFEVKAAAQTLCQFVNTKNFMSHPIENIDEYESQLSIHLDQWRSERSNLYLTITKYQVFNKKMKLEDEEEHLHCTANKLCDLCLLRHLRIVNEAYKCNEKCKKLKKIFDF